MSMKTRDSSFELLRIIAAVMILYNHIVADFGGQVFGGANYYLTEFFHMGGKFGVCIFLFIGCWFMVDNVDYKRNFRRIVKILGETLFYGIVIGLFDFAFWDDISSIKDVFFCFKYWYTFGYVAMLVIIVFADKLKKLQLLYIGICSVLFIGITIYGVANSNSPMLIIFDKALFIGPVFFTYVFLMVKTLKPICEKYLVKLNPIIFLLSFIALYLLMYGIFLYTGSKWIRGILSPLCIGAAFSLFIFFACIRLDYNAVINKFAMVTYATYLIQTNNTLNMMLKLKGFFTEYSRSSLYFGICTLHVISIFVIAIILNSVFCIIKKYINTVKERIKR